MNDAEWQQLRKAEGEAMDWRMAAARLLGAQLKLAPVAFDYGGTIRTSDGVPACSVLLRLLSQFGHPCHIISAVAEGWEDRIREEISQHAKQHNIPLAGIHMVPYPPNPTPDDMYKAGQAKGRIAHDLGCVLLVDDSRDVCRGAANVAEQSGHLTVLRIADPAK
jgi:hypothetical protein